MTSEPIVQGAYFLASALFVLALMWMSSPKTARRGVWAGELGMLLAVIGTLLHHEVVNFELIALGFLIGSAVGVPMAYLMPMTAIPQRTAISHAFGALAVGLIGVVEYYKLSPERRSWGLRYVGVGIRDITWLPNLHSVGDRISQAAGNNEDAANHV